MENLAVPTIVKGHTGTVYFDASGRRFAFVVRDDAGVEIVGGGLGRDDKLTNVRDLVDASKPWLDWRAARHIQRQLDTLAVQSYDPDTRRLLAV